MYYIGLVTKIVVPNSQDVPISQVVLKTGFTVQGYCTSLDISDNELISVKGNMCCIWILDNNWTWYNRQAYGSNIHSECVRIDWKPGLLYVCFVHFLKLNTGLGFYLYMCWHI